ncbi:hypothetical protein CH341_31485 [Rhodoplanes roseus]|uniref:Uncharacterized protein n=1 Tax=Rhodoplanes roseus TaxID=29409 RepID=A0A327K8D4_9BRAD|nr:hypothetical protein CH341_31485 [Rhodoplanes roseus]
MPGRPPRPRIATLPPPPPPPNPPPPNPPPPNPPPPNEAGTTSPPSPPPPLQLDFLAALLVFSISSRSVRSWVRSCSISSSSARRRMRRSVGSSPRPEFSQARACPSMPPSCDSRSASRFWISRAWSGLVSWLPPNPT